MDTPAPTIETPKLGMTGRALRTANDTITRMHVQAIAQRKVIEQLRAALTTEQQECQILREELAQARQAAGMLA